MTTRSRKSDEGSGLRHGAIAMMHDFIRKSGGESKSNPLQTVFSKIGEVAQILTSHSDSQDEFGIDPKFMERLRPLFQFLYYVYFRVDVHGARNLPLDGPAIFVANHSGTLPYDGAMVHLAVYNTHPKSRGVRFLVDDFVFGLPLLRDFIMKTGGVPASMANAVRLIERGEMIAVFPEGVRGIGKTYDRRYQLERFGRGGFVRLALETGAPLIPMAVIGAEEIHPLIWKSHAFAKPLGLPFIPLTPTFPWLGPLGLVPLPSKWRVFIGKPIRLKFTGKSEKAREDFIQEKAQAIRGMIQKSLNIALKTRDSVWV